MCYTNKPVIHPSSLIEFIYNLLNHNYQGQSSYDDVKKVKRWKVWFKADFFWNHTHPNKN